MSDTFYGGTSEELHPEHAGVVIEACERYEEGKDTPQDRVVLWFDVFCNEILVENYYLKKGITK